MIEFTDILLGSTLPLHPYLIDHPHLSLRLVVDGNVCGETPAVNGELSTGIWEINSSLHVHSVFRSVTLAVVASKNRLWIRLATVNLSAEEILTRVKEQSGGYQEFTVVDSSSSMQFLMTCMVKASPSFMVDNPSSSVVVHNNQTVNRHDQQVRSNNSKLPSRDELESFYAKTIRITDRNDSKARALSALGDAYHALYQDEWERADLDKAISLHEEAMQFTSCVDPQLAERAHNLAIALIARFQQSGDLVDIEVAISHCESALKFTEDLYEDKPGRLSNLGVAHQLRFKRVGDPADLDKSISCQRQAVKLTPGGHPSKPSRLCNLGAALQSRFECLGNLADIEEAISGLQKAVDLTQDGHPSKPSRLNNLGGALQYRFQRLGSLSDIEDAISGFQMAVELTPDGHPDKPSRLNNLGGALQSRFQRLGNLADIEDAISGLRKAVDLTADDHPDKPSRLNNLGGALQRRFERLGNLADMEDTIARLQKAVDLTLDDHPDKPIQLSNLGNALQFRFERLGSLADIEDAVLGLRNAVDLTPDGHPDKPVRLSKLGNALQSRFEHLGSLTDIEDAILGLREAVFLTPDGHSDIPDWLNNLGGALQRRFERLGSLTDIEDAILGLRKAVYLTPDGHSDQASCLNNLGIMLQSRFERLGSLTDIEDAISGFRNAVGLSPDGHNDKPGYLSNLGNGILARFNRLGVPGDLESALSALSAAAKSRSGSAMVRFKAARKWAKVTEEHSRSPLDAFSHAIELLPRIAWLGLTVTDQHALLADVGGVVRDAVAAAIRYGEYETAVIWAEQGRSIVWQNLLGLRSPVDDLRRAHPQLADQLQTIARQLQGSSRDTVMNERQPLPLDGASGGYTKLAVDWDTLIEEIRRLPNFEGFLRAKSFSQLAPAAHEGPVVILNVNSSRCDALVLVADNSSERNVSVVNIPLERFSYETSGKLFKALTGILKSAGVRERNERKIHIGGSQTDGEAKFKRILRILWQDVAKPVIEGLAFQTESKRPPRIWWCATGLLAFLPIHASGLYDTDEIGEKASDYVISSYTPTLTAILETPEPAVEEDFQVLTVAQAWAPGASPIPKTEDEVRIVHRLTTGVRIVNLMKEDAMVDRVREEMMKSNWIHLACHGQQNPSDPMESGFLLHDKMLKLSEIVKMSLPKADFAFLSACQTAMGDEKIAEESVHLAAGMFLLGCRGVIATTWSIRDDDAPKIAEDVYSRIFKDGKPNRKEAAYALHEAVKRLRESGAYCTSWVPFIHIGR